MCESNAEENGITSIINKTDAFIADNFVKLEVGNTIVTIESESLVDSGVFIPSFKNFKKNDVVTFNIADTALSRQVQATVESVVKLKKDVDMPGFVLIW